MKLTVLITLFNEESIIYKTHQAMVTQLESMLTKELSAYELLYVDDGSKDNTLAILEDFARDNPNVHYLSFSRNFGRESGILAGFRHATGDAIMVMDGDLQHPPYLIPLFVAAYKEGYDVVSGQRDRAGENPFTTIFARAFYHLSNHLMDVQLTDGKSELKLLSRRAVETFISLPEYNRFNKGLYEWMGYKEKVIPYKNHIREAGKSKFGFVKSLNYAAQGIISFNDKPLRYCLQLGAVSTGFALLYLLFELLHYLSSPETAVSGYFTTIAAVILFSGVQLISIGILGEYIGKIYYEVKRRPHYIIEKTNIDVALEGEKVYAKNSNKSSN
ncbi:glycosyltransferase PgfS [Streptococcus entericus]|uniref:glycosyltransferase PgfS n=1 Tax=Streptococcus entericus TaxID=155680 RepID=UPI00037068DE|nr:glycosyltransferase family 2 protein [Streptococcus entericus]